MCRIPELCDRLSGVHLRGFDTAILVALIPLELQPLSGRLFVIVVELYKHLDHFAIPVTALNEPAFQLLKVTRRFVTSSAPNLASVLATQAL